MSSKESQVPVDFSEEFEYVGDVGIYHWMKLMEGLVEKKIEEGEKSNRDAYGLSVISMAWLKP